MGKHIGIASYWVGSVCAGLALFARGLDVLGKNFLDFDTRGGGIGYHSLMDGTLFFYAISIATMIHAGFKTQKSESPAAERAAKVQQNTSA